MKDGESGLAAVMTTSDVTTELTVVQNPSQKEEIELKLQQSRDQLATLRRQQEELERQKGELEDLRRKQDEYARGKARMIEQLNRGLVLLEREHRQAEAVVELCANTQQAFRDCLDRLHAIHDEQWTNENLRAELSRALGIVESANIEHSRACAKLPCMTTKDSDTAAPSVSDNTSSLSAGEFIRYVKIGGAVSLPVIIVGTLWLFVLIAARH